MYKPLCKDLLAGGLCLPLSKHFKRKMLWSGLALKMYKP
jgi:hypothetical protein